MSTKTAGSLILSCLDLALCLAALLLGFVFRAAGAYVLFTVVLPPLLLITLVYAVVDFANYDRRKQATSLLLMLPTLAVQIWFYRNLDL
ncbi:MAG: hypothetical protein ACYDDS_21130 [Candidatus Sulfotelmatobacter sp.]